MAISSEETTLLESLQAQAESTASADELNGKYYRGAQVLEHLGIAVPPELRRFETVLNWNRVTVDSVEQRLRLKEFVLPDEDLGSSILREHWDANNLDSESRLLHKDTLIYGRGFVCIGANDEDPEHPLITVESPREMTALIDHRTRRISAALRQYGGTVDDPTPIYATLYLPDTTIWLEAESGGWKEVDRDDHKLGRVPIVMFLNRRQTGIWTGESEMVDVIPLVDAAARTLTNMQVAAESVAIPKRWVVGMSKGDFVDAKGSPIPVWQSYMGAIWANGNKDAKVGQFDGASLDNFWGTVNHLANDASSVTGLPTRYFGQTSVNPAAEGAIRADETRLIMNVESKATSLGDGWAWVQGIAERFRTKEWPLANQIKTEWFDAGTPTFSQKADALSKLYAAGNGVISREGVWDELQWSEARKARERQYFEQESRLAITSLEKDVAEEV